MTIMEQPNNPYYNDANDPNQANSQAGYCPFGSSMRNPYYNNAQMNNQQPMYNPYITNTNNNMGANQPPPPAANASNGTGDFIKGALIGAAVTYLITNDKVQSALFKTAAKTTQLFQVGMEEIKERFEDAKAEVAAENYQEDEE